MGRGVTFVPRIFARLKNGRISKPAVFVYAGVEFVGGGVYKEEDLYVALQKIISFITSFLNQIWAYRNISSAVLI